MICRHAASAPVLHNMRGPLAEVQVLEMALVLGHRE